MSTIRTTNDTEGESETPSTSPIGFGCPTILVVDDEQGILDSYIHYLAPNKDRKEYRLKSSRRRTKKETWSENYNLLTAKTGEDAIILVLDHYRRGGRIELGFFDMKMPGGMDGLETISQVLQIDPEVNCVIVTAYQDKPIEELGKAFGRDRIDQWDYISKPFTNNEIVQKARNMIANWHWRREQENREAGLRSSIFKFKDDAELHVRELAIANAELQVTMSQLKVTNERLHKKIEENARMERGLRMAHKLEAVGQLAAGIAHEISTPTQYIGNNTEFLEEAFSELRSIVKTFGNAYTARNDVTESHRLLVIAGQEAERTDLDFLSVEIPAAFVAMNEGITTISRIVGAMRIFAHPDTAEKELGDINRAVESTLIVAYAEYRYLAKIETDLGDLPSIPCLLGGLNQVFLNIIVNAAHAIEDSGKNVHSGSIEVKTWSDAHSAYISFKDNGCGIEFDIQDKIFDPFFTTKEVGRGTGQGLAIARDIIVDTHNGEIVVSSAPGEGATFTIVLPL